MAHKHLLIVWFIIFFDKFAMFSPNLFEMVNLATCDQSVCSNLPLIQSSTSKNLCEVTFCDMEANVLNCDIVES